MTKNELKEILVRVVAKVQEQHEEDAHAPLAACLFGDNDCDMTTKYAINEEA